MAGAETDSVQPNGADSLTEVLDRVDRVFAAQRLPGAPDIFGLRPSARARALATLESGGLQSHSACAARLFYTADLLGTQAIELAAHRERAVQLIANLTDAAGISRHALAREALRNSSLLGFAPAVAIEMQLGLLMAFTPVRDISLWMADSSGTARSVCHVGEKKPNGSAAQELARQVLSGKAPLAKRGSLIGLTVKRWHEHTGALIARPERGASERFTPVIEEALPLLGAILERETLIARNAATERTLTQTYERRLKRLGFDIHDGPLQDLAFLGEDVQLLRRQLTDVLAADFHEIMLGRVDDLHAQLVSLDSDLRRISASLQTPLTAEQSLLEAAANAVRSFAARSQIEPAFEMEGDLENLTDSQQMALLSILREALSNVREHSDASEVAISLTGNPVSIELRVTDNGSGFDVERTLVRAAHDGRFGLAGMHERARLLGGEARIESGPGRPTEVSVMLPRWRAVAPD